MSQQIDSFENFVENLMELVKGKEGRFTIPVYKQYKDPDDRDFFYDYEYEFAITRCFLAKKNIHQDKYEEEIHPMAARLRDLTYCRQLKVDIEVKMYQKDRRD